MVRRDIQREYHGEKNSRGKKSLADLKPVCRRQKTKKSLHPESVQQWETLKDSNWRTTSLALHF